MRVLICLLVLIAFGLLSVGARCIENVAVRQEAGNTYLLGEIYNDTDVQGVQMVVRASLKDASGAVVATKDTTTCPPDLQPGGLSSYAVRFDESNLPADLSWEVRPIGGRALPSHLPSTGIVVTDSEVRRVGADLLVTFVVRNDSQVTYEEPQICAVMYHTDGKVGSWSPFDPAQYIADTSLSPGETVDLTFRLVAQDNQAAHVRVWLWIPGPQVGTSPYQPVMTDKIPLSP